MNKPEQTVVNVPTLGDPPLPPLTDGQVDRIITGLTIPNQAASKSLAIEVRERRKQDNRLSDYLKDQGHPGL